MWQRENIAAVKMLPRMWIPAVSPFGETWYSEMASAQTAMQNTYKEASAGVYAILVGAVIALLVIFAGAQLLF